MERKTQGSGVNREAPSKAPNNHKEKAVLREGADKTTGSNTEDRDRREIKTPATRKEPPPPA
jgi:hypothetical protein